MPWLCPTTSLEKNSLKLHSSGTANDFLVIKTLNNEVIILDSGAQILFHICQDEV